MSRVGASRRRVAFPVAAVVLLVAAGCGGRPARVAVPSLDPQAAGAEAMRLHDKNGDGLLDDKELVGCPGLKACAKWVDTSGDSMLSAEEIAARVQGYLDSRAGLMTFSCKVTGGSAEGAEVTLEPEPFLGEAVKPAKGTVGRDGTVRFTTEGFAQPGVQPGMYRVRITRPAGKNPPISAKYNTETTLGVEANAGMLSDEEHVATRSFRL